MTMRILIVSNMDAARPYGAWTRPYYLGEALSHMGQVFQLGFDTSDVLYARGYSTQSKSIPVYVSAILSVWAKFEPDVIYCHETFPAMAAYLATTLVKKLKRNSPALVFDMHALHAAEYKALFKYYDNRAFGLYLFAKSYFSQRFIARRRRPIMAASSELKTMLIDWYGVDESRIEVIPNGAPTKFLSTPITPTNPYPDGFRYALLVAPKNMMPNVLAVTFTIQIAERLLVLPHCNDIRIAIAGGGWENEEIEKYPNLIYLGFVEDIMAYIDHADICLLPYPQEAVCGGARNKALDYFARQKIVLSTNEGMRGLSEFKSGDQFFLSSYDPDQFAHDLYHIMQNHHGYQQVGVSARRLVETEYNWQKSAQAVLSAFNQII